MTRPRLTATTMHPALRAFNAKLYCTTRIDELMFSQWLRLHLLDLRIGFHRSAEPDSTPVEWTFGIWARLQFLGRRVAA